MMAQKIEYREKMKYYINYPLDYMPPEDVKRVIGEDEQCEMCWNPFYYNWCDYCYRPTNEKNVIIIINKPESPLTVKIDAGSSGMQNRDKSGRLEKWKVKNSNFKNKNKRTIKKRKDIQEIEENFQNQSHNCLTSEDIKEVKFGSDNDKENNQNNKLDEDDNEENVEFPKNQNAENVPKNQNAENVPKNQTAGKKRKINLDEDEKEYVEGDLDDNDKKIKKMQMKNQNCKIPPPPPPPTKGLSNFLKPHRPTKTMKAFVKIKKLSPPHPPPPPTKGPSNLLKPHRPTKSPRKKLSPPPPPPPKNLKQNLKRGHDLFEKDREDVISLKKRIKSPGKGKQTAGKKRNRKAAFLNLDEEEDEESPKRTRRQTRSATRDQEDTRNSNQANFQGGF